MPQPRSRVILRSFSPSSSHFRAMDVTSTGQSVFESIHSRNRPTISDCLRKRCLESQFEIGRTRDSGARIDQIRRIEDAGAVLALIAASPLVTTVGAGADNVAIGKET